MPRLLYTETAPQAGLAGMVDCLWSVVVQPDGPGTPAHWVLPDGCFSLSVGLNPYTPARLRPPALAPFRAPCKAGEHVCGVRFRPGSMPTGIVSRLAPYLQPGLAEAEVLAILETSLLELLRPPDPRLNEFVTLMRATHGRMPVSELARGLDISPRHLERLTLLSVGLAPKAFARVTRLQSVVRAIIAGPRPNLAGVAADFGYADQTHMTREFTALAGITPAAYLRMIADVRFVLEPAAAPR